MRKALLDARFRDRRSRSSIAGGGGRAQGSQGEARGRPRSRPAFGADGPGRSGTNRPHRLERLGVDLRSHEDPPREPRGRRGRARGSEHGAFAPRGGARRARRGVRRGRSTVDSWAKALKRPSAVSDQPSARNRSSSSSVGCAVVPPRLRVDKLPATTP